MTQALYRRYRPQTFGDVIGQEHVTEPLQQALATGRVGHAYLFSGPRGCGKTTSARILARCLNCEQGPTPDPCGECASCLALARGGAGSVDVIEIDAASHGGVDDARDLREKASYGPAQSRYRVFIIDEAHMVTPQGFNALLKIVEEPPEHVKFIFATTEPEKVIGTIRSRTHHYPFRLVPPARLHDYLGQVSESEGVEVEPGVLSFVVRAGGGSVRDSLSVLDQLMAGAAGTLTYAGAAALLGFTEGELLDATIDAIAAHDGASVFRQIDKVIETGHDPRRFVEDLLERFRDLIIVSAVGSNTDESLSAVLRGLPEDQIDRLRQQAAAFGAGELSHAADVTNAGLTAMTGATAPRLQLELLCARLLLPRASGEDGMIARVDRLERRLEMGGPPPPSTPASTVTRDAPPAPASPSAPASPPAPPSPTSSRSAAPASQQRGGQAAPPSSRPPAGEPPGEAGTGASRPEQAPRRAAQGEAPPGQEPAARSENRHETPESAAPTPQSRPAPGGIDTDAIRRAWPDVLATIFTIRRATWTFLSQHSQVLDYDGQRLLLGISSRGLARTFQQGQHAEVVRQALIDSRGVDCRVEGVALDDIPPPGQAPGPGGASGGGPADSPAGSSPAAPPPAAPPATGPAGGGRTETRPGVERGAPRGRGEQQRGRSAGPGRAGAGRSERGRAERGQAGPPHGQVPPDLPEPPDDYGPPEYDAPPDMYERGSRPGEAAIAPGEGPETRPDPVGQENSSIPRDTASDVPPSPGASGPVAPVAPGSQRSQRSAGAPGSSGSPPEQPAEVVRDEPRRPPRPEAGGRRPGSGHEAFRAAMAARRARATAVDTGRQSESEAGSAPAAGGAGGERGSAPPGGGGDLSPSASGVSADDEDISDLTQVGKPVIAEVLGGVVIGEIEE